jgi:hypothetical protein
VKELGFLWKKTRNSRVVLIEKHDVRFMRVSHLTALNKYREEGRPTVYEDETYVHSSHTGPKNWSDDCVSGLLAPVSKGERLVILNAGSRRGFIYLSSNRTRKLGTATMKLMVKITFVG